MKRRPYNFRFPPELIQSIDNAVARGEAKDRTAYIEQAVKTRFANEEPKEAVAATSGWNRPEKLR